jgi:high frequency lysogenization protein
VSDLREQAIALAGVAQAARLVDQVARTGNYPERFLETSIESLFRFDATDAQSVFGGLAGLKLGLDTLAGLLTSNGAAESPEVTRYLFALLYLERRFSACPAMMSVVHSRLQHASFRAEHFSDNVGAVCHSISGIYQDTLSTLRFRIKVNGSVQHLENERNADLVRALLLAGVRSAFLWHQLGGRRWRLPLQRRKLATRCLALSRDLAVV